MGHVDLLAKTQLSVWFLQAGLGQCQSPGRCCGMPGLPAPRSKPEPPLQPMAMPAPWPGGGGVAGGGGCGTPCGAYLSPNQPSPWPGGGGGCGTPCGAYSSPNQPSPWPG